MEKQKRKAHIILGAGQGMELEIPDDAKGSVHEVLTKMASSPAVPPDVRANFLEILNDNRCAIETYGGGDAAAEGNIEPTADWESVARRMTDADEEVLELQVATTQEGGAA